MRKQLKAWEERAEGGEFGGDGSSNDDDDKDGEGQPPKKMTEEEMLKELEQFDEAFKGITFADSRKQANLFGEELGHGSDSDPTPPAEEMEELRPTPEKFDKKTTPMVPRMRLPVTRNLEPVPRPVKKSSRRGPLRTVPVSHKKTAPPRTPELQDEEDLVDKMYGDELEPTRKVSRTQAKTKTARCSQIFLFAESGKEAWRRVRIRGRRSVGTTCEGTLRNRNIVRRTGGTGSGATSRRQRLTQASWRGVASRMTASLTLTTAVALRWAASSRRRNPRDRRRISTTSVPRGKKGKKAKDLHNLLIVTSDATGGSNLQVFWI